MYWCWWVSIIVECESFDFLKWVFKAWVGFQMRTAYKHTQTHLFLTHFEMGDTLHFRFIGLEFIWNEILWVSQSVIFTLKPFVWVSFFLLLFSLCRKIYHFYSRILCVMTKKKPNRGFMFFFLHSNFWFFQFAIFCVEVSRFFEVSLSVSLSLSHLHIMR